MKTETYLIAAFIWEYKEQLEKENELSPDEAIYVAQDIVKDYLGSDDYIPQDNAETDDFFHYVENNLTDYI